MKRRPLLILILLACGGTARAQVRNENAHLQASDGAPNDRFGSAVDIDGDRALVGAYGHGGVQPSGGAAYLYARDPSAPSSWVLEKKFTPVDLRPGDLFGIRTALDGSLAACSDVNGTVRVFARDQGGAGQWGEEKRFLFPFTPFGPALALEGDRLVIGVASTGQVHVFERDLGGPRNWGLRKQLSKPLSIDFGSTVALSGSALFVTDLPLVVFHYQTGTVHVYERDAGGANAWGAVQTIASPELAADMFGRCTVDGDRAVIGAFVGNGGVGAAYVYARGSGATPWSLVRTLTPAPGEPVRLFGRRVALEGDLLAVGVYFDQTLTPMQSSAHLFVRDLGGADAWGYLTRLAPAGELEPGFSPEAISGGTILGANEIEDLSRGGAYVFDVARPSSTVRNGSGANPVSYASSTAPLLGSTWTGTVDLAGHPGATASVLVAYARPSQGVTIRAGEILVDTTSARLLVQSGIVSGSIATHRLTIPNDPRLIGFSCATQVAILGGGTELCNAIDINVGR